MSSGDEDFGEKPGSARVPPLDPTSGITHRSGHQTAFTRVEETSTMMYQLAEMKETRTIHCSHLLSHYSLL